MDLPLAILGVAIIVLTLLDALWTTLWVDGGAGPLTRRASSLAWRIVLRLFGNERHRALSAFGPFVLVATLASWIVLVHVGWVLLFGSDPSSLSSKAPGDEEGWTGRIWFVAYAFFTVGNGDFTPKPGAWQVVASFVGATGMVLVTLAISYLLQVISAVVGKRAFASQVMGLGERAEDVVVNAWNGRTLTTLDRQLAELSSQLSRLTQQYESYPVLQYYHAAARSKSPIKAVAVLDDALTLMRFGVEADARPGVAELRASRASVGSFLGTLSSALISPASEAPPPPDLSRLRDTGVPTVADEEFGQALGDLDDRRRSMLGLVQGDGWTWER